MQRTLRRPRQNDQVREDDSEALILGYTIFEVRKVFRRFKTRIVIEDQYEGEERSGVLLVAEVTAGHQFASAARIYKKLSRADVAGPKMRKMAYDVIGEIERQLK